MSESWFYKWRDRPPTRRDDRRVRLTSAIRKVFHDSGGTYGSPRIGIELRESGWQVSDNTIAQLMAELGLVARVKRRRRGLTRQGKRPAAPDLVKRVFTAPAPDVAWCGDMTEIRTCQRRLNFDPSVPGGFQEPRGQFSGGADKWGWFTLAAAPPTRTHCPRVGSSRRAGARCLLMTKRPGGGGAGRRWVPALSCRPIPVTLRKPPPAVDDQCQAATTA
ncbi:IS3 family transposase [Micromonospora sp. DT41]|uniref:IS3 family transposase n=1 Tax=Micromonospora sp. DT41 TaxID=3393437 RepID=UPI003CFB500C